MNYTCRDCSNLLPESSFRKSHILMFHSPDRTKGLAMIRCVDCWKKKKDSYLSDCAANGLCTSCKKPYKRPSVCEDCRSKSNTRFNSRKRTDPTFHNQVNASARESHRKRRESVIRAYGGKCACCGDATYEFLTLDHIGGRSDESPASGPKLYQWVRDHNFPSTFRLLCLNCNFSLGHAGTCKHSMLTQEVRTGRPRSGNLTKQASDTQMEFNKNAYLRRKMDCLVKYSNLEPSCACCRETDVRFLSIDHVNNDGAEHRKVAGKEIYLWLRRNNYPEGFQVLCHNCNFAKGHFGSCPHTRAAATVDGQPS